MRYVLPFCICLLSWGVLPLCRQPYGMALLAVSASVQGGLLFFMYRKGGSARFRVGMGGILGVALLLRIPFLLSPPLLSDDIYRYLFDGEVQSAGQSPYAQAPANYKTTDPIVSDLLGKVNHPELVTLYPPAAQLFFRMAAPLGLTGMKALLVVADMAAVCLLLWMLPGLGLPRYQTVLYAWNPLVVWEIAWSGHIDALALPFLLGAGFLVVGKSRRGVAMAGALFAVGVWVKLLPLMFAPFLLLGGRKRWGWFLVGGGVVSLLLVVPYLPHMEQGLKTLKLYGATWEFSGFIFRALRHATGMNAGARLLTALLFCGCAGGLLWWQHQKKASPLALMGWVTFFWLLTTPTLHPWYGLYLAMFLPLMTAGRGGVAAPFVLTLSPLLGYGVLVNYFGRGVWVENPWVPFWVFLLPVVVLGVGWLSPLWCKADDSHQ